MDNHEIRLVLLAQYYRVMFTTNEYGSLPLDPLLKGISGPVIYANMVYLIDKGLIDGRIHYGSTVYPILNRITAHGVDAIEEIMDKSLVKMGTEEASEIKAEHDPGTKFSKFCDLCIKAAPLCETVANVARAVFVG